jgi:hypothetical protein
LEGLRTAGPSASRYLSATEIFGRHPEGLEPRVAKLIADGSDPFRLPGLHFVRETAESIAINKVKAGAVIMAGSGGHRRPDPSPHQA